MQTHRTTILTIVPQTPEPIRPLDAGAKAFAVGLDSLKWRAFRRVSPLVWGHMMAEVHEVVDRWADASDEYKPAVRIVS